MKYLQICHKSGSAAKCLLIHLRSLLIIRNISWEEVLTRAEYSEVKLKFITHLHLSVNSLNVKTFREQLLLLHFCLLNYIHLLFWQSGGWVGAGGPRGVTLCSRSGGAAVRRHPSSKVRSSSCALLEQPWEIPHAQGKRNPSKMVGLQEASDGRYT